MDSNGVGIVKNSITTGLHRRYISVLIFIAILSITSFIILEGVIHSQQTNGEEINIAGRQRMLSQKIALFASDVIIANSKDAYDEAIVSIKKSADLMEATHNHLIETGSLLNENDEHSNDLHSLYFGPKDYADRSVREYLKLAKELINASEDNNVAKLKISADIKTRAGNILQSLNSIVFEYQKVSEKKVDKLEKYQSINLLIILLTLVFSGIFVFFPMVRKLKSSVIKLSEAEERFRSISDSSVIAMVIAVDQDGSIISWNPAAEKVFGYCAQEIIGMPLTEIMPERYRNAHLSGFKHACASDEYKIIGKTVELEALHKEGHEFPIELSIGTWIQGGRKYFSAIIQDISKRKQNEKELAAHRDRLQELVDERTLELVEAKEFADAANQAKSEFLSGMSHELRTPLNSVLGFSQLLESSKKDPLSERQRESVRHIHKAGDHLLELINEVLDLAKIEAGKISLSVEVLDPRDLVDECISFAMALANKREIVIHDNSSETLPNLFADRLRCKQVILNLMSNAIKYNHKGGQISLSTEQIDESTLRIIVKDYGFGIKADLQDNVFEPFQRLGAETTEIEGTGIGLVLSKKLVEEMNGSINFSSTYEQGSSFWIDLPIANEEIVNSLKSIDEATFDIPVKNGEIQILYIEDNPANIALIQRIIEEIPSLNLISTHTAELGIALAEDKKPDVILLDINLPGMNGFEAIKFLKKSENARSIPIIVLSADAMPNSRQKGQTLGAEYYLTKPLRIKEFTEALTSVLEN